MTSKLPINIDDLINGTSVEWERIEFKEGWNPLASIQTICGFANDFNNLGGGYVIVGIAEKDGKPILPPKGLTPGVADKAQKELLNLGNRIHPNYFPLAFPVKFQGKLILVIWAIAGDNRPYKAPDGLGKGSSSSYYIRRYSNTINVKGGSDDEKRLFELAARIPFDDRINNKADVNDIDKNAIKSYLRDINSALYKDSGKTSLEKLCRQLQIARGSDESLKPVNVGLLIFGKKPSNFFKGSRIEIIEFNDDAGTEYTEKKIEGVLQDQLRESLAYFKNKILKEKVRKLPGKAASLRTFNYPYQAFEEILANAVYHRSYEINNPIEIRIYKNKIEVLSFPGALPPIVNSDFKKARIVARDYRNRRIGDFLKELHLTEGRATGIPTVREALKSNGSPSASFVMDSKRSYFLATLYIHKDFKSLDNASLKTQNIVLSKMSLKILKFCKKARKSSGIFKHIGLTHHSGNFKSYIQPLLDLRFLNMTIPDKPSSSKQAYLTTALGEKYIQSIF